MAKLPRTRKGRPTGPPPANPKPEDGVFLTIDGDRVVERDGRYVIDLTMDDLCQVPAETLRFWRAQADQFGADAMMPFTVSLVGKRVPEGELSVTMPSGGGGSMPGDGKTFRHTAFLSGAPKPVGTSILIGDQKRVDFEDARNLPPLIPSVTGGASPAFDLFASLMRGDAPPELRDAVDRAFAGKSFDTTMPESLYGGRKPGQTTVNSRTLRSVHGHGRDEPLPTLSDMLMFNKKAHVGAVPRKMQEAITQAHRTSRAFVFDRAASYRVGEICSYEPDLIADQQEFARAPYPRTWVELDANALYDAMEAAGLPVERREDSPPDDRIGFLFTDRGIYTASMNHQEDGSFDSGWAPYAFRPHQPMRDDQLRRWHAEFGASEQQLDGFLWGNAYDHLTPTQRRSLRAQHGFDVLLPAGWAKKEAPLRKLLYGAGAGDLKVALCCALLLIRPNLLHTIETREPGRKLVLGRPTTFIAHRVVTIKLQPDRLVRKIRKACKEEAGRSRCRWYEVRGHYAHNHKAKTSGCVHDWQQTDPNRWECHRGCGGKRAWRTYPEGKGDASIGVVTKHYVVKP